jgi:hypothetical protein
MTERATKNVIILVKTDTWLRQYYYDCFKKSGEKRKDFDSRIYSLGLQSINVGQNIKKFNK